MHSFTRLASMMAKRRLLLNNTIVAGGLLSALWVTRDEETSHEEKENRANSNSDYTLFRNVTGCDFYSKPAAGTSEIMVRGTMTQIEKEKQKATLTSLYGVDWSRPLGEGGFGAVYLGREVRTGDKAAVKEISKQYTNVSTFQQEMNAFFHIRNSGGHPNICGMREYFDEGNFYYLVLDLVQGGEMFDHLIDDGSYSEADAARLVREVGSALYFLHGIGLVHSDLKPENLMLSSKNSSDAVIKVVDFGCAEIIDKDSPYYNPHGNESSTANTPGYSPPEMIDRQKRQKHLQPSVDMFSMGVIIYIMLTGVHPFDIMGRSTDEQMNQRVLRNMMPPLRDSPITAHLSASAIDLIERLIDWNPETRMTAFEMLNHPWVKGETATTGKIVNSDKKLKSFRKCKSGIVAQAFASMVKQADDLDTDDATRKTSLIQRSFQMIDSEQRGYITTKDLKKLDSKKLYESLVEQGSDEDPQLSLSGFTDLLSEDMKNVYVPAGHVIFEEGDEGDSMYFLNSGRVEVTTKDGFRLITEQGDFFGEGALLNKQKKRCATITSITPVHAIEIGRTYFEKYLSDGPEIELALIEKDRVRKQDRAKAILGLQHRLVDVSMKKGDCVYKQWEEGKDVFLLEDGLVDVDVDGSCVYLVQPGELFGEYAAVFNRPRNTSARCVSDECKVHVMEPKDFERMMNSNPAIGEGLREVVFRREFKKALVFATKKAFPSTEEELREAFDAIDTDSTGDVDIDEVDTLLRKMDQSFTDDDIAQILSSVDLDGSRTVSWLEFKRIFGMSHTKASS